jgi:UrcA family protein
MGLNGENDRHEGTLPARDDLVKPSGRSRVSPTRDGTKGEVSVKNILPIAAAGLCLAFACEASAQEYAPSVQVAVDEWQISTPEGAHVLLSRLGDAAMEACGAFQGSLFEYRSAVAHSHCFRAKLDQAVAQVDSPVVSQVYADEGPMMARSR